MQIRRRQPCQIHIGDTVMPDLGALLRGECHLSTHPALHLLCAVTGRRLPLAAADVALLAALPGPGWIELESAAQAIGVAPAVLAGLVDRDVLLSDDDTPSARALREGEARLEAVGWHPDAALYHAASQWQGVVGEEGRRRHDDDAHRERLQQHAAAVGPLPTHAWRRDDALSCTALPPEALADAFGATLRSRRTTRHFRTDIPLPLADFTRVLYGTFGTLGAETLAPGMVALRRTSASGGGLHPIDAYPLVIDVEGLVAGVYHYESATHALALLQPLTRAQARAQASALTIGQDYFAEAHALVFHVARLDRHHWKYRRHPKAYKAVLLDSGHLSQTFYLLAADRGLGAFYTAAINDVDVATLLKLRPQQEIAIGANGVGVPDPGRDTLHLKPAPWAPVAE